MSIVYPEPGYDRDEASPRIVTLLAAGFPPPRLAGEADLFARHKGLSGHAQEALTEARIVIVGAGGLGSWVAVALARSGVRHLTIIDPDRFDRTNASRQLMFGADVDEWKALAVARNVLPHMIAGGTVTGLAFSFQQAVEDYVIAADILAVGVDNNRCRWDAAQFGLRHHRPVVFSMLSGDATRAHVFLQRSQQGAACLWCALPNLDPEGSMPCTPSTIPACLLAAAHATHIVCHVVMRPPGSTSSVNWRSTDLTGSAPEQAAYVGKRRDCRCC